MAESLRFPHRTAQQSKVGIQWQRLVGTGEVILIILRGGTQLGDRSKNAGAVREVTLDIAHGTSAQACRKVLSIGNMEGTLDEVSVEGLLHAMIGINYWALQDGQLHPAALLILNNLPEIERAIKQGWKLHTATIKRR